MAGSDIMLMPSFHEGFPVVLVESQAAGLPALISDTISSDVDLAVDLIDFQSLMSEASSWADKLAGINLKKKLGKEERLSRLRLMGFDVKRVQGY